MDYSIDQRDCWHGQEGPVFWGCVLSLDSLPEAFERRSVRQVHGKLILDDANYIHSDQEADGLISDQARTALIAKTADCVPVHISDGRRIGIVHAGWRGARAGVVRELGSFFQPKKCRAVIGPSISADRYEVDRDLYEDWLKDEPAIGAHLQNIESGSTKRMFDLRAVVADQLRQMGVAVITLIPVCTVQSQLPSYRRDGKTTPRIYNYIYRR